MHGSYLALLVFITLTASSLIYHIHYLKNIYVVLSNLISYTLKSSLLIWRRFLIKKIQCILKCNIPYIGSFFIQRIPFIIVFTIQRYNHEYFWYIPLETVQKYYNQFTSSTACFGICCITVH